ncbi:gastrula zinc finger protein xFG20-1 isoform X2 [Drosophila guanche]|uniref:Blast:Zinc finger protein 665 n=1 Tax=Drosophila guanche TaxID=7266 RepID=A0A3B0JU80_DROGU|nr:gastrula zinc finger protein xFG20-1 isoform X1 [Drosophila guanche]XP_034134600.1 gastrula zinc finger protein xFG20-1 isoform X2 [Drosophila guanche]SPP85667.1 blast:Zinc finger protein 665 [Drosophila guanche]
MAAESMASGSSGGAVQKMLVEITTDGVPKLHCPVCNKALISLAGYVKHVKKHEPPGGFQCRQCEARYCHEDELTQHVKGVHAPAADEERKRNSKTAKSQQTSDPDETPPLKESLSTDAGGVRQVECKCCSERFSCSSNLAKHRRSRPETCGKLEPSPGPSKGRPRQRAKVKAGASSSDEDEEDATASESDDDIPLASRIKAKTVPAPPQLKEENMSDQQQSSDSGDECPDFEPNNSDEEADAAQFQLPAPAMVKVEAFDEDFEYQDASLFVKTESADIFSSEKDKLLDVLLSTDEGDGLKPFESLKVEHAGGGILDEIAAVPLGEHTETAETEEDVLSLRHNYEEKKKRPKDSTGKRKYRKRGTIRSPTPEEAPTSTPKRVAKITKKELKERLKMINKMEKTWKCPHCVKIYHIRKPYEKHLRDDHKLNEQDIKDIFKDVDVHAKLDEEVFKCPICSKIYLVEKRLETHLKVHGEDGSLIFKCPCYCNLFFASKELATEHAHQQHKELLYCEKCDKYMTGHDSLKNHEKNFHSKKEPRNLPRNLICDKCGKKFTGRTSLSDHVRSDCGRLPLYQCNVCGKRLSTAGILKTHLLLHQSETPYQCDKCGKTFKVKAQYKSHLKTRHTEYKPYKCHLCPKEYPYRESLLTHMTVHTGIKRFLCNNCGKRFTCISNLQAHRKVHADTCGQLPLNAKATQYMGVQRGKLLMGAKPEAGMEYEETKTLIAQDVIDKDMPMAQELNFPSDGTAPLATVPLNYASTHLVPHIVLQTMQAEARRMD